MPPDAQTPAQDREYPRLRHCTMLDAGAGPLRLVVGDEHYDLAELAGDRATFLEVKRRLDGRHSIADIAAASGLHDSEVREIVATFAGLGLLRRPQPVATIPMAEFRRQITTTAGMWRRQIGYHRLFQGLDRGVHRREVLDGLLIETYHVVRNASRHIAVAVAHADSPAAADAFAGYLADERDHGGMMLECCRRLGMDPARVTAAHPLIGTMSLLAMLSEIGRASTLAYAVSTGLFEAAAPELPGAADHMAGIAAAYGLDADVFAPLLDHARGDVAAGHSSLFETIYGGTATISAAEAHACVNWMHDLKHAYDQYHDQILQYYSDASNYIPRLRVDYFSL